ncbi:MAG: hypothetical protein ACKVZJ_14380 [Phycisphaerales bacterium]
MADSVRIMCPNLRCRAVLAVPNEARGRMVRCKSCATNIRIPEKKAAVDATAVPADAKGDASKKAA